MRPILLSLLFGLQAGELIAVPLQTYTDYVTAYPSESRKGQWIQLMARGSGTNDMYVMEVDPTTGAIPVSATFSDPTAGTPGDPVPAQAGYIAGIDPNGDLRGVSVDLNGFVNVNADLTLTNDTNYGVVGANTLRTASQIGNATGAADFGAGNSSAQTLRTVIATDQPAIPTTPNVTDFGATTNAQRTASVLGNSTGEIDYNAGNASAQTPRVVIATDQAALPVSQSGNWSLRLQDGSGNAISSTAGALDVNIDNASITVTATDLDIRDLNSATDSIAAVQSGTWNINNITGTISLPTGAATEATLSALNTKVANDFGAASGGVRAAAQIGNASGAADFGTGTAGGQTLRVVTASNSPGPAGRAYGDSATLDYSSSNVGSGAWVELDSSTAAVFNLILIFSSCGETVQLATGAAASETRVLLVPPGGLDAPTPLTITAGTRLSLRTISGTCSSGSFVLTGLQ